MKTLYAIRNGSIIIAMTDQGVTINGKLARVIDYLNGWKKVYGYAYIRKHPKRVIGVRKRKQAMNAAIKRYIVSMDMKFESQYGILDKVSAT